MKFEDVVEIFAAHHVWPHYDNRTKVQYWKCSCDEMWPTSEFPNWQDVEDRHQAFKLLEAFPQRRSTRGTK